MNRTRICEFVAGEFQGVRARRNVGEFENPLSIRRSAVAAAGTICHRDGFSWICLNRVASGAALRRIQAPDNCATWGTAPRAVKRAKVNLSEPQRVGPAATLDIEESVQGAAPGNEIIFVVSQLDITEKPSIQYAEIRPVPRKPPEAFAHNR